MSFRRMFAVLASDLRNNDAPDFSVPQPINVEAQDRAGIPQQCYIPAYRCLGLWKSELVNVPILEHNGTVRIDPEFLRRLNHSFNEVANNPDFLVNLSNFTPWLALVGLVLEVCRNIVNNAQHGTIAFNVTILSVVGTLALLGFAISIYSKYASANNVEVGLEAHETKKALGCRL